MNSIGATAEFQLRKPQKLFLTKVFYSDKERTNRLVYLGNDMGAERKVACVFMKRSIPSLMHKSGDSLTDS